MRFMLVGGVMCAMSAQPSMASPTLADCDAAAHATVLQAAAATPLPDARAIWLDPQLLRWPGVESGGRFRLHHSTDSRMTAEPGIPVAGATGAFDLELHADALPPAVAARFRHVAAGVTLRLPVAADTLRELHRQQLLLVQEDADGRVLRATRLQSPGALDALYASAADAELGATVAPDRTTVRAVGSDRAQRGAVPAPRRHWTRAIARAAAARLEYGSLVDGRRSRSVRPLLHLPRRRARRRRRTGAQPRDGSVCHQPDDRLASQLHRGSSFTEDLNHRAGTRPQPRFACTRPPTR